MSVLLTIVFGAFIGWLASIIMKRNDQQGWLGNIIVGIVGSFLGLWLAHAFSETGNLGFWGTFFWEVLGAVILCGVLNLLTRKQIR